MDSDSGGMITVLSSCGLNATSQRSTGVLMTSVRPSLKCVVVTSFNSQ